MLNNRLEIRVDASYLKIIVSITKGERSKSVGHGGGDDDQRYLQTLCGAHSLASSRLFHDN